MKLSDIRDLNKEDILSAVGLASKPSTTEKLLGMLSIFGVGLLVGAGTALLLAPKSGHELRDDLGQRIRKLREDKLGSDDDDDDSDGRSRTSASSRDEARP